MHAGNQVFTPGDTGKIRRFSEGKAYVISEIEKENRLNDTILHPDQILKGIVIFQVDNYTTLFDRSFSLRYDTTPIPSKPIEKSLEALTVAEQFDYSIAFDTPPYDINRGGYNSYYPPPESHYVWANWVNKTVFEYYKKYDEMSLSKEKPGNIPLTEFAYAVKVIPEQDLTVFHKNQLHVVDDTGEEFFNKSIDPLNDRIGLAMLDNQTYSPFSKNMPHMFIPRATIVHISFYSLYGWNLAMRFTFNNQDIILDEQHNITLARYDFAKMVS